MDSPPLFPAPEAELRGKDRTTDLSDQQDAKPQPAGNPSHNGNHSLSAPTTDLASSSITSTGVPARHPIFTVAFVVLALYLGVVMVILPWRDAWIDNSLLYSYPALRSLFA